MITHVKQSPRFTGLIIDALLYTAIFYTFTMMDEPIVVPFSEQIPWLIAFSIIVSMICLLSQSESKVLIALAVRQYVLIGFGYPFLRTYGMGTTLLMISVVDSVSTPWESIAPLVAVALVLFTFWFEVSKILPTGILLAQSVLDISFAIVLGIAVHGARSARQKAVDSAQSLARSQAVVRQLSRISLDLQERVSLTEERARFSERRRISRDIHDILGYALTNIMMMVEGGVDKLQPEERTRSLLQEVSRQAREGLHESRQALRRMRVIDTRKRGISSIRGMVEVFRESTDAEILLDLTNSPDGFGEHIDDALYRIVQEALTNAFRHGHATAISIVIKVNDGRIHLLVQDNGSGSDGNDEGIGLKGMRERVHELGGMLEAGYHITGFEVHAVLPQPVRY